MANGQVTEFTAAHREFNDTPPAMQLTLTVPMSYEDIAAAYYLFINGGGLLSDLDSGCRSSPARMCGPSPR